MFTKALGFVLFAVLAGVAIWAIIRGVLEEPAIVGSFVTAAAAVSGVVAGKVWEKRLDLRQAHRERIAPIYQSIYENVAQREARGNRRDEKERAFWKKVQREFTLYAPGNVLKRWLDSMVDPAPPGGYDPALLRWERFLFAVRADLGHDDRELREGDLLRIYVGKKPNGDSSDTD